MSTDVVIVGAGVAGLSAAIRLKQLAVKSDHNISVVVLEKGVEVGAHVLSGAIIDPVGLDQLLPDWHNMDAPLTQKVTSEQLSLLTAQKNIPIPAVFIPRLMHNKSCYVGSLGALTRWLGTKAEELGVEIYPGFAGAEVLHDEKGAVKGVATPDQGLDHDHIPTEHYMPGMELHGLYTLIAEGARGYLAQQLMSHFELNKEGSPAKYALGIKELWQVSPDVHRPGQVEHMVGWPLENFGASRATGGSFVYHYGENLVSIGLVMHADYKDPTLSVFDLFQTLKTHPSIRPLLLEGKRIGYGARTISEGGLQSVPQLVFPGGVLMGCSAGLMNVPRLKGSHNAMLSGILAAQSCFEALREGRSRDELLSYQVAFDQSCITKELHTARNAKPLLERFGTFLGGALGLAGLWGHQLLKPLFPRVSMMTLPHPVDDRAMRRLDIAKTSQVRFTPDGIVTFDRASSLLMAGVAHDETQRSHLRFKDADRQLENKQAFGVEPAEYYCPAGVYEYVHNEQEVAYIHMSPGNCLHCKMCDIKDPAHNIVWHTPPSGGPTYVDM